MGSSGPAAAFFAALRDLRLRAGEPSVREIARVSGRLSHDTVHRTLTGPAIPRWANVEAVVHALGADPEAVKPLWLAARVADAPQEPGTDEYLVEPAARSVSLFVSDADLPEPAEIRVVLVEDHPVYRFGLRTVLESAGFQVVAEAANGAEALDVVAEHRPDVVVMDLRMPELSGVEATARLVDRDPGVRILVLTMFEDTGTILKAIQAGALGYLLKHTPADDIVHAVRQVAAGMPVFTAEAASSMLAHYRESAGQPEDAPPGLSPRETEVLRLLASGLSHREIAQELAISVKTVYTLLARAREKLGIDNHAGLVRYAIEHDLVGE